MDDFPITWCHMILHHLQYHWVNHVPGYWYHIAILPLTDSGSERWVALHKACCMRSPPIPQLMVFSGLRWRSHTAGYRAKPATRESPSMTTFACPRVILLTCCRWQAYHPGLFSLNSGLEQVCILYNNTVTYLLFIVV